MGDKIQLNDLEAAMLITSLVRLVTTEMDDEDVGEALRMARAAVVLAVTQDRYDAAVTVLTEETKERLLH